MASAAAAKKWPGCSSAIPGPCHQPQIGFVDQGRRLERLPRLLPGELLRRQLAQLVVDQRQQLLGGGRVALFNGRQDQGYIIHNQSAYAFGRLPTIHRV